MGSATGGTQTTHRSSETFRGSYSTGYSRQEEKRRLQKRAEKMEPWRDSDLPEAYFNKFEMTMKEAGIPDIAVSSLFSQERL